MSATTATNTNQQFGTRTFSLTTNHYNLGSFFGRYKHFFGICNPRNSFFTPTQIEGAKMTIEEFRAREKIATERGMEVHVDKAEYQSLRKAQRIAASAIHPDTNEVIPWAMRMCSFVPTNAPIIFGMIVGPQTTAATMFWQWMNQTYNAGLNYGNRNASSTQTANDIAKGYSIALVSACTVALGIRHLTRNTTRGLTGGKLIIANCMISYAAVATSGFLNAYFMRRAEMDKGITFQDKNGNDMGISKVCARKAVIETALSRVVLAMPVFALPAAAFWSIERMGMNPRTKFGKIVLEMIVLTTALTVAMPACAAAFPQESVIKSSALEPEY